MRKELDEKLVKDFPLLYRDRHGDKMRTCMCWGFCTGDGWEPIIRELSEKLEKEIAQNIPETCECNCDIGFHDSTGKCLNIFHVPYSIGKRFHSADLGMFNPKTLRQKFGVFKKRARYILFLKPKWIIQLKINDFLRWISDRFDINKKVPCDCVNYYPEHARALQVKEKFGTLRFYLNGYATEAMHKFVREAETKSETTCEECGQPGILRKQGWWKTNCDKCHSERYTRRKESGM